jgi:hypothetical protein
LVVVLGLDGVSVFVFVEVLLRVEVVDLVPPVDVFVRVVDGV